LLIIIDNLKADDDIENVNFPDNGQGRFIHIPVVVINQADGDKLRSAVIEATENGTVESSVVVKIQFPNQTNLTKVAFEIWYTSSSIESL